MSSSNAIVLPSYLLRLAGGILFLAGFLLLYLVNLGSNLYYTQIYNNLSVFLPKITNVWLMISCIMLLVQFSIFAITPNAKFNLIGFLSLHSRMRELLGVLGLVISLGIGLFVVLGPMLGFSFAI